MDSYKHNSVTYLPQISNTKHGIFKHIELCGRTCYKSEDKITTSSANKFVSDLIINNHYSVLEHGTVYLTMNLGEFECYEDMLVSFNPTYCAFAYSDDADWREYRGKVYITTNFRYILEHNDILTVPFITDPTDKHIKRITLKMITNIGLSRELNRHRCLSISEQSTRFCNYSTAKFNNLPTMFIPDDREINKDKGVMELKSDIDNIINNNLTDPYEYIDIANRLSRLAYVNAISKGAKPQIARNALPLNTITEVVYTAFETDWITIFDKRLFGTTGTPHPDMINLMEKAREVLIDNNLWNRLQELKLTINNK